MAFLLTIGTTGTRFVFVPSQRRRWNIRDGFSVGNESLFGYRKCPMSNRGSLSRRTRGVRGEADYAALTVFPNLDAKARRGK